MRSRYNARRFSTAPTYEKTRGFSKAAVMEIKRRRRVHVGPYLTFLFENTTTIRYQVQEMMRAERIETRGRHPARDRHLQRAARRPRASSAAAC